MSMKWTGSLDTVTRTVSKGWIKPPFLLVNLLNSLISKPLAVWIFVSSSLRKISGRYYVKQILYRYSRLIGRNSSELETYNNDVILTSSLAHARFPVSMRSLFARVNFTKLYNYMMALHSSFRRVIASVYYEEFFPHKSQRKYTLGLHH